MSLAGKTILITGSTDGVGRYVAERLAADGASVIAHGRDQARGEALVERIEKTGGKARFLRADLASLAEVRSLAEAVRERCDGLDILVNNAGMGHLPQPLEDLGEDEFDRILAVNVKSIYLAAKEVVPRFKAQRRGVILNIASTAGVSPRPRLAWYNASKGWVITATRAMAVELAPFGVRVCALNPVAGETPMLKTFMGEDTPEMRAKFLATIPIGRFSTPEDLGNAACFLCSDEASMITGVAMEVDGGRCI
jgi:3-oxoacyl-[acyl-carrier protein] reductase